MIDVGSGDKPHWRADVLVDRFPEADQAHQRSGGARARVDRVFFDADAARLPFADGVFDYAICSHVLEHAPDPAAVIAELTRVARAGYVEVPEASSAKIVDFPSHLWWCRLVEGTLEFEAKTTPWFDAEIHDYLGRSGLRNRLARLLDADLDHRVISLHWEGTLPHRVLGRPPEQLLDHARDVDEDCRPVEGLASRMVTKVASAPYRWRDHRVRRRDHPSGSSRRIGFSTRPRGRLGDVALDDLLAPGWRSGDDRPVTPGFYRVGADQVSREEK